MKIRLLNEPSESQLDILSPLSHNMFWWCGLL